MTTIIDIATGAEVLPEPTFATIDFVTLGLRSQHIADAANVAYWTEDATRRHQVETILNAYAELTPLIERLRASRGALEGRA